MTGAVTVCGCPLEESLFELRGGGWTLLVLPGTGGDRLMPGTPPAVWCGSGHGWVTITNGQARTFTTMCGSSAGERPGLSC